MTQISTGPQRGAQPEPPDVVPPPEEVPPPDVPVDVPVLDAPPEVVTAVPAEVDPEVPDEVDEVVVGFRALLHPIAAARAAARPNRVTASSLSDR